MKLLEYKAQKPFQQKHLLTLMDYTPDEIMQVLCRGAQLKALQQARLPHAVLAGQSIGLYFTKPSARTRVSFEVGIHQLGAQPVVLDVEAIGMGQRESIEDVAGVLSRFLDGLMIRTFEQNDLRTLAAGGNWAVINGLTDDFHPCQALADLLTLWENFETFRGLKLAYIGDGNNVAHSLMLGCAAVGVDIAVATPKGYEPNYDITAAALRFAAQSGSTVQVLHDPRQAVHGAHAVYTDVWASMGQEVEKDARATLFADYQVNENLMRFANNNAIFLHCLPAHRGDEVTAEVIDGTQSRVFAQAENRLHMQKGVMAMVLGQKNG